jgi:hypothetical protein
MFTLATLKGEPGRAMSLSVIDRRPSFKDVINFVWSRDMLRVEAIQQFIERIRTF